MCLNNKNNVLFQKKKSIKADRPVDSEFKFPFRVKKGNAFRPHHALFIDGQGRKSASL